MSYQGVTPVSLTDFGTEQKSIDRRRKLAELMQRQAVEPIEAPTSGGQVGPISPVSVLAKMLQGYMSGRNADKLDEREAALKKSGSEELARAVAKFGKPFKTVDEAAPTNVDAGGEPAQNYTMKTPDTSEMLAEASRIMNLGVPGSEAIGSKMFSTASEKADNEAAYNNLTPYIDAIPDEKVRNLLHIAARANPKKAADYFGDVAKELSTPKKPNEAPTSVQEFTFAQTPAGGNFKGTYPEWVEQKARSGRAVTQVNVGPTGIDYGKPEDGLVWAREPNGTVKIDNRGAPIAIPYQGGKAFLTEEQRKEAARQEAGNQRLATKVVTDEINRARNIIKKAEIPVTGIAGAAARSIPGTPAQTLKGQLATIKARIGFDELSRMRKSSPTGAALGNVTVQELEYLQNVYGNLEQSQNQEALLYNLDRLENEIYRIVNGGGKASSAPSDSSGTTRRGRYDPATGKVVY